LVELRQRRGDVRGAARRGLSAIGDGRRDLLVLRHLRQRLHALELLAKRGEVLLGHDRRRVPRAAPRRQIAGQIEKADLLRRLAQKSNQLRRGGAMFRSAKDDQARTAGHRYALGRAGVARRQRRGGPLVLHLRRQAVFALADVPRSGNPHGEIALRKLLIDVRGLGVAHRWRPAVAKQVDVKREGLRERRLPECAARAVRVEQRRAVGHGQHFHRLVLVRRQEDRVASEPLRLDALHRRCPLLPRARRAREAGGGEDVAAVEEHARVDVPRDAVQLPADDVRGPDAGEVVALFDHRRRELLERAHGHELRDPGVAYLRHVRRRLTHVRGEQLLVRCGPRDLLHDDVDAGIGVLELGDHSRDDFPFVAHGPEFEAFAGVAALRARECRMQNAECRNDS